MNKSRILVVDDSPSILRVVETVLSKSDFLNKLSRYEAALSNQLQRAMVQFEARQAERFEDAALAVTFATN